MSELALPLTLTGKKELVQVQRELETLIEQMIADRVVKNELGQRRPLSPLSSIANELITLNGIAVDSKAIADLIKQLQTIRDSAPMLRLSFASEPDRESIVKIVSWFRKEIYPGLLLQIGIQPTIVGGCIVQTPGNRYDFSLRRHILGSTDKFRAILAKEVFGHNQPVAAPVQTQETA
jgi:F0F1-type ATP synthase delta subunit